MIEVEYLDHMGDDLAVVNAARVSFDKESEWQGGQYCEQCNDYHDEYLAERDVKLIKYLAEHRHKSPFNHAFAKFRVNAPVFVARQLVKHEYLVWNEVSRRYVDSEPEFYSPESFRSRSEDKKQGSGPDLPDQEHLHIKLWEAYCCFIEYYNDLLRHGVAPEQARMILPQSMMTEWIWSGSLYAFAKMCALRTTPDAQYESRIVAEKISNTMSELFPVSWDALKGNII